MKSNDWKRLVREATSSDVNLRFRKNLAYFPPIGRFLFGIEMETMRDPRFLQIARVALPLFVPTDVVYGGQNLRGPNGTIISASTEEVLGVVSAALRTDFDEEAELRQLVARGRSIGNITSIERAAYSLFLLGATESARQSLDEALASPDLSVDQRDFVQKTRERMRTILQFLQAGDTKAVSDQLESWTKVSLAHLGLQRPTLTGGTD
ncbi:hypothetical protein ACEXQB_014795 [Herbiconiux sp. P18]|uniref:hypothetical protein n=1 Tax=Herbiconiux liangxiaofengii TaxID=3342795 RepID=UPI0035B9D1D5